MMVSAFAFVTDSFSPAAFTTPPSGTMRTTAQKFTPPAPCIGKFTFPPRVRL